MPSEPSPFAFGPVPSRRLGRSLGINNVPPKSCSYSCVYCQVGRTPEGGIEPRTFHSPEELICVVTSRVQTLRERGEAVDYLTFVPDGEPCLDSRLAEEIDALRSLDVPIAVISNGSLLWREDARKALALAAWVSLKVDRAVIASAQVNLYPLRQERLMPGHRRLPAGAEARRARGARRPPEHQHQRGDGTALRRAPRGVRGCGARVGPVVMTVTISSARAPSVS
jgi:MoaA/NifB/PqqE/SkfB family radical SAM enzyme